MKLWKDNKLSGEHEMSHAAIAAAFWADVQKETPPIVNSWPLDRALREFITRPESGLGSTFDEPDYVALFDVVLAAWPDSLK